MVSLLLIPIFLAVMWAFVIRPQQRRVREHQELVAGLRPGLEVMTTSGLYGVLVDVGEEVAVLEIAPGTRVRVARASIGALQGSPAAPAPPAELATPAPPNGRPASGDA